MRSARRSLACFFCAAMIAIAVTFGPAALLTAAEPPAPVGTPADKLVERALTAEVERDAVRRSELINQALASEPNNAQARWADGQVSFGGQWLALEDVEESAAHDPNQIQYRELRSKKSGTVQADQSLAVWCEKHRLDAEARAHWRHVLELDPGNTRAINALDLHLYHEELLTSAQLAERQRAAAVLQKTTEQWRPKLAGWRRDLEGKSDSRRERARESIRAIDKIEVIPVFESLLQHKSTDNVSPAFSLEFVGLLGRLHETKVIEALVRQATDSNWPEARGAAASELSKLELLRYVPYALGRMRLPMRREFSIIGCDDGSTLYEQRLYAAGAEVDEYRVEQQRFYPTIIVNLPYKQAIESEVTSADLRSRTNRAPCEMR
jgi:hypothetical protein